MPPRDAVTTLRTRCASERLEFGRPASGMAALPPLTGARRPRARGASARRWGFPRQIAPIITLLAVLFAATSTGCRATLSHAAATSQPAPQLPRNGNAELMEYIAEMPFVSAEAAYRAVHVLNTGTVFDGDFPALSARLAELKIIDGRWRLNPNDLVNRSEVGYMICRAAGVNTGLNWRLTGLGRYAWRELNYRGIVRGQIGEYGYVSGGQFLGILSRAEEYMSRRELRNVQTTSLGPPPS